VRVDLAVIGLQPGHPGSPTEYGNPGDAVVYRIRTVDERVYSVTRYVVSDSSLVVEAFRESRETGPDDLPPVPFRIPLSQVKSVDRVTMDRGRASAWVFGVGALFIVLLFFSGMSVNLS
jgi:hypothetical protein